LNKMGCVLNEGGYTDEDDRTCVNLSCLCIYKAEANVPRITKRRFSSVVIFRDMGTYHECFTDDNNLKYGVDVEPLYQKFKETLPMGWEPMGVLIVKDVVELPSDYYDF